MTLVAKVRAQLPYHPSESHLVIITNQLLKPNSVSTVRDSLRVEQPCDCRKFSGSTTTEFQSCAQATGARTRGYVYKLVRPKLISHSLSGLVSIYSQSGARRRAEGIKRDEFDRSMLQTMTTMDLKLA